MGREITGVSNEIPYKPEALRPSLDRAIKYFRRESENLINWPRRSGELPLFEDLIHLHDVLGSLDDNLQRNNPVDTLIDDIAPHAMSCANEDSDFFDAVTHETALLVEKFEGKKPLDLYWLGSLKTHAEQANSLSRAGGVYGQDIKIDKETTTNGGEEIQQALAASVLHRAYATTVMGNTRLHPEFDDKKYPDRSKNVKSHKDYLEKIKNSKDLPSHLAHIKKPVVSKKNLFSHNQDLEIYQGEPTLRETLSPEKELVRLIRGSKDGKSFYFYDMTVEQCLAMDSKNLGDILNSQDDNTDSYGLKVEWTGYDDGFGVHDIAVKNKNIRSTPYSISSRVFESQQTPAMQVVESGNYISHIAFDYGKIYLKKSHVPENGAAAKLEAFGIAHAVQINRKNGESLAPDTAPMIEIFPSYHNQEIPNRDDLRALDETLTKAKKKKKPSIGFHKDPTLENMLKNIGLENVRIRFEDILPEQSAHLISEMKRLNDTFTQPRRDALKEYINLHPPETGSDEKSKQELYDELVELVAPEVNLQDMIAMGMSLSSDYRVAVNELPLLASRELNHNATSIITVNNGKNNIFTHEYMDTLRAEKGLGKLACNIYNVYKLLTASWRKAKLVGAESLGRLFSEDLTDFMTVDLHISTLGTMRRVIDDVLVEIDGFETAKPDPNEERANAMSFLTLTEKDQVTKEDKVTIRTRFRDNLTPDMLQMLQIDNSEYFNSSLDEVMDSLTKGMTEQEKAVTHAFVRDLQNSWITITNDIGQRKSPDDHTPQNILVLTRIYRKFYSDLSGEEGSGKCKKALQILLLAGNRRLRLKQVNFALNMSV